MVWEIDDLSENEVIIRPEFVNGNCIRWDFALDSSYELCALFPRMYGEKLVDYKKGAVRPVLYHKNLRSYHIISPDNGVMCYSLYPATIYENILHIGDQKYGNAVYIKTLKKDNTLTVMRKKKKRKWIFFRKETYEAENVTLHTDKEIDELFYKISSNNHTYRVNMFEDNLLIFLEENETISFYQDQKCSKTMEIKEC